jgi:hypothetical protein
MSRCQIREAGEGAPWAVVYVVRQSHDGYARADRFFFSEKRQREEVRITTGTRVSYVRIVLGPLSDVRSVRYGALDLHQKEDILDGYAVFR